MLKILKKYSFISYCFLASYSFASDYGTTGLIDIPSARMQPDATFTSTISYDQRYHSTAISYQIFPWLEGTFRYSGNKEIIWDRNYEIKVHIFDEGKYLPEVAVGIRDVVGTGLFGAEYLVVSKQFGRWDATLGIGWGRLAGEGDVRNPLISIDNSFSSRSYDVGKGGELSYGQFFSGPKAGIFTGISYDFESLPVELLLEYNPDDFAMEVRRGGVPPVSNINVGIKWEIIKDIEVTFSRQNNQFWGLTLQTHLDTKRSPTKYEPAPFVASYDMAEEDLPRGISKNRIYDLLLYDLERSGLQMHAAKYDWQEHTAQIELGNKDFPYWPDAIDKAHSIASIYMPPNITMIDYIVEDNDNIVQNIRLPRQGLSENINVADNAAVLPAKHIDKPTRATNYKKNELDVIATINNRVLLFDPDSPLAYQFYLNLATHYNLPMGWRIKGAYAFDMYNTFDELNRPSTSVLPHVRSDGLKYLKEDENRLSYLYFEKRDSFNSLLHYRLFAGVLEQMYSGVGGEILYQPFKSRLAFGLSGNWVQQRDYDDDFATLDYSTTTAHASVYWATPFHDIDVAVHAGKYLAKDYGATFEVRRTFDNGWMIGLWATLTDVPFDTFGEGSFDKGMFFEVPIDNLFGTGKRSSFTSRIRPIQRDGGARLEGYSGKMWWDLRDSRYDVFKNAERGR